MKFVKKITALFLALTMVMAMGITAFAAETPEAGSGYTISVKSGDTHTYTVYQILTGTLAAEGEKSLGSIAAGKNYNSTKQADAAKAAEEIAKITGTDQEKATKIAEYVNFESEAYGTVSASSPLNNVPAGYYLIKDTTDSVAAGDSLSTYIVKVVNKVEIEAKKGTVDFEKKIKDVNDSQASSNTNPTDWQDSADYDIGDSIPFKLQGTVAENYASYETYTFKFHDVEEESLTFQRITSVYVLNGSDKTELTSDQYTLTTTGLQDSCTFEVAINDIKNISAVKGGSKIVVEYESKLNDKAVFGQQGNVNKAQLEYSNNPNDEQGGTGKTEWDNVIVFTYKVIVNKVDSEQKPLAGAKFKLQKKNASGTYEDYKNGAETEAALDSSTNKYTVTFKGLDDGDYKLVETLPPAGYNKAEDIEFSVTADHKIEWKTEQRTEILTTLSGGNKFTGDVNAGSLTTDVVNRKGSELPETGGMGTTVLYIAGIAMIVAAGIVVIARKRNA